MTRDLVAEVTTGLVGAIQELEDARSRPRRDLWRSALDIEHRVLSDLLDAEGADEVVRRLGEANRTEPCRAVFAALETAIESDFASLALLGETGLLRDRQGIAAHYLTRYEELARREVALAHMGPNDHVLFVGSGPFPISAIEYNRQAGCRVDCIDFLDDAIRVSQQVIHELGLERRIQCHLGRGEEVPVSDYSVVLVGVLAQPKAEVLRNIAMTRAEGCRVLVRTTYGLRTLIYAPIDSRLAGPEAIREAEISMARGDQVISSILNLDLSLWPGV